MDNIRVKFANEILMGIVARIGLAPYRQQIHTWINDTQNLYNVSWVTNPPLIQNQRRKHAPKPQTACGSSFDSKSEWNIPEAFITYKN